MSGDALFLFTVGTVLAFTTIGAVSGWKRRYSFDETMQTAVGGALVGLGVVMLGLIIWWVAASVSA